MAGVRCTNGSTTVDWTPEYDATIVTRILDAGGLIMGKSGRCSSCASSLLHVPVLGCAALTEAQLARIAVSKGRLYPRAQVSFQIQS